MSDPVARAGEAAAAHGAPELRAFANLARARWRLARGEAAEALAEARQALGLATTPASRAEATLRVAEAELRLGRPGESLLLLDSLQGDEARTTLSAEVEFDFGLLRAETLAALDLKERSAAALETALAGRGSRREDRRLRRDEVEAVVASQFVETVAASGRLRAVSEAYRRRGLVADAERVRRFMLHFEASASAA
jgi:hypothetical protein